MIMGINMINMILTLKQDIFSEKDGFWTTLDRPLDYDPFFY